MENGSTRHRKIPVSHCFPVNTWHICFPVNFAKFLRTPFLWNTSGGCFWVYMTSSCMIKNDKFNFKYLSILLQVKLTPTAKEYCR